MQFDQNTAPKLLLAERDEQLRETLRAAFEVEGYEVLEADSVEACLQLTRTALPHLAVIGDTLCRIDSSYMDASLDPLTICTDLCRDIRLNTPLPIAVMVIFNMPDADGFAESSRMGTAIDPSHRVFDQLLAAGATDYMTRPTHLPTLLNRVRRLVDFSALQQEALFQEMLLRHSGEPIVAVDESRHVRFWSEAAEAVFCISSANMIGQLLDKAYEIMWSDGHDSQNAMRQLQNDGWWHNEAPVLTHDGRSLILDASVRWVSGREGNLMLGVLRDITERKRIEMAERDQRNFAEALRDTASALARSLDLDRVMTLILENVGRVVAHKMANIMLIEGDIVRVAFSRGYTLEMQTSIDAMRMPRELPVLQSMIETGQSIVIQDTGQDPDWVHFAQLHAIRSWASTPIRANAQVIGFLSLDDDQPNRFRDQDGQRLRAFADQAAIAIENAQLHSAVHQDAAEMRALHRATSFLFTGDLFQSDNLVEVGLRIGQTVTHEFAGATCTVYLVGSVTSVLTRLAHVEAETLDSDSTANSPVSLLNDTEALARVARERQLILLPYTGWAGGVGTQLFVPMATIQGIVGVLVLQSERAQAFSDHDQRILLAFAERAASVIENIRLYKDVQQRVEHRTAELNRVKERVEAILNHSSDAILLIGVTGTIQQCNRAFNTLFGYMDVEMIGTPLIHLVTPETRRDIIDAFETVVREGQTRRIEVNAVRDDTSIFPADIVLSPIGTDNHVTSAVCSVRDNTERKRMELDLRAALFRERRLNELKSHFVARASHEFRTPLTIISTASELLESYSERMNPTQRLEKFATIRREIIGMTTLLDDLLVLSRSESVGAREFDPHPVNILTFCETLIREVQESFGREHTFQIDAQPVGICAVDEKLLRRILLNLLSNAVKYAPKDSRIDLRVEGMKDADDVLILRVHDQGMGIPLSDQPFLFQPFYRAGNALAISGTGLGLAIVRQMALLHGGDITFESAEGQGTTFIVCLRCAR